MIIKWYNRDEFSDRDMAQAKAVSNRLQGKKVVEPSPDTGGFFSGTQIQIPIQYQNSQNLYNSVIRPSLIPWELRAEWREKMIGVSFSSSTNSTMFTNCCNVAICDDQKICPQCHKEVIPPSDRWEFAFGKTRRHIQHHFEQERKFNGLEQAARVAARLRGEAYAAPRLCLICGKPEAECYC